MNVKGQTCSSCLFSDMVFIYISWAWVSQQNPLKTTSKKGRRSKFDPDILQCVVMVCILYLCLIEQLWISITNMEKGLNTLCLADQRNQYIIWKYPNCFFNCSCVLYSVMRIHFKTFKQKYFIHVNASFNSTSGFVHAYVCLMTQNMHLSFFQKWCMMLNGKCRAC